MTTHDPLVMQWSNKFSAFFGERGWNVERIVNPSGFIEYEDMDVDLLWVGYRAAMEEAHISASKEAVATPVAWLRGHLTHTDTGKEYDEECLPGSDQPEGMGWLPLFTHPASPSDDRAYETGYADGIAKAAELLEGEKRDAERYRWLRDHAVEGSMVGNSFWLNCDEPGNTWDARIDAAMATQENGHD